MFLSSNDKAALERNQLTITLIAKELKVSYQVAALRIRRLGIEPIGVIRVGQGAGALLFRKSALRAVRNDLENPVATVTRFA
jgi:hypothetical protein